MFWKLRKFIEIYQKFLEIYPFAAVDTHRASYRHDRRRDHAKAHVVHCNDASQSQAQGSNLVSDDYYYFCLTESKTGWEN